MKNFLSFLSIFIFAISVANAQNTTLSLNEVLDKINPDSLKATVQYMEDFQSRLCTKSIGQNRDVAQYLVDRLQAYGIENAKIDSFYVQGNYWLVGDFEQYMYNVLGTLHGSGDTDSTVIIGAHLDAMSYIPNIYTLTPTAPGADDNATGCAVMIEMARVLYENNITPYHNIDFMAYDAEEIGLMGAYYDADKRRAANENVILMLNNDMVGNQPTTEAWAATLYSYTNSYEVTEKAKQALINYTTVTPDVVFFNSAGSDSYPYFFNDYKVNFAIEKHFSPYYHSENDLTENLNFEYCRQIARMNFVLLADYAAMNLQVDVAVNTINSYLDIFPNPVRDVVRIHNYTGITIHQIDIFDLSGRLLETIGQINQQQNIIHIDNYASGFYMMRIYTDKGVINKKIIKQ